MILVCIIFAQLSKSEQNLLSSNNDYIQNKLDLNIKKTKDNDVTYIITDNGNTIIYSGTGAITVDLGKAAYRRKKIVVSEGITIIESRAFYQVSNPEEGEEEYFEYEEVELPRSLVTIGSWAFVSIIPKLKRIHFPDYRPGVPQSEITDEELENFYALRNLGGASLMMNNNLKECNIPATYTSVEDSVFTHTSLSDFRLNSKITSIGNNAFQKCTELKEIRIPSGVKSIGTCAFANCPKLEKIIWENSIHSFFGSNTFEYSTSLEEFVFPPSAELYSSGKFFYKCTSLKKCIMPVTLINQITISQMFTDCTSLCEYTLPENIKAIGPSMFQNTSIKFAFLPESVTTVSAAAFKNCPKLQYVNIPYNGSIWFGNNIFANDDALELLVIHGNLVQKLGSDMFGGKTFCYYGTTNTESSGHVVQNYTKIYVTEAFQQKFETFGIPVTYVYGTFEGYPYELIGDDTCKFPDQFLTPSQSLSASSIPTESPSQSPTQPVSQSATISATQTVSPCISPTRSIDIASQSFSDPVSKTVSEVPNPDQDGSGSNIRLKIWHIALIAVGSSIIVGIAVAVGIFFLIKKRNAYNIKILSNSEDNVNESEDGL